MVGETLTLRVAPAPPQALPVQVDQPLLPAGMSVSFLQTAVPHQA